jgi:DNA-binding CsgD family transcriptional regulator
VGADRDEDDLEGEIYEAALVPERWPAVLERLAKLSGAEGAVLFGRNETSNSWTSSPGVRAMMRRFVEEGWSDRNLRIDAAAARGLDLVPAFHTDSDYFDDQNYRRHPFFAEFLTPAGFGWSASMSVRLPDGDVIILSIERALANGPMPAEALTHLNALRPHLARSAMVAARLAFERTRTAVDTLATLGFAAAAVSPAGKVLLANSAFDAPDAEWTTRGEDRIALNDRGADALLGSALRELAAKSGVRSIPIRPQGGKVSMALHVVPVRRSAHEVFHRAGALLVVTKAKAGGGGPELIQALFDLTPSEAAIAHRLGSGETADEVAKSTGRSVLTVRTQVKSVLAKTGTRRQSELVRLLTRLVPPGL